MATYINSLIGKIFKILPLKEEVDNSCFCLYLDSLWVEMSGALKTFPCLWDDPSYLTALNIVSFLTMNCVDVADCRREVFRAIELIKCVSLNGGDEA